MQKPQALLHAREAKPNALNCGFCIKTRTSIADGKLNLSRASPQACASKRFTPLCWPALRRASGKELGIEKEKIRLEEQVGHIVTSGNQFPLFWRSPNSLQKFFQIAPTMPKYSSFGRV